MKRPPATAGMRHVALFVDAFAATEAFYCDLMGMSVEWRPDPDNVYLTSGNDNLALHRVDAAQPRGALDHIGFFLSRIEDIDAWHAFLQAHEVRMFTEPRTHRDGARSFYCSDPSGNRVQVIYHPPIAAFDSREPR